MSGYTSGTPLTPPASPEKAAEALLDLARQALPALQPFYAAEEKLFRATAMGEVAELPYILDETDVPSKETDDATFTFKEPEASPAYTIRARCLQWLCCSAVARPFVTHKGVQMRGVYIRDVVDIESCDAPFPLAITFCLAPRGIILRAGSLRSLILDGSHFGLIKACGLRTAGDVLLNGAVIHGIIDLMNAHIGGYIGGYGAYFHNPGSIALVADDCEVGCDVFLRKGFLAKGTVRLSGAKIGGQLNCSQAMFRNPGQIAINADRCKIEDDAFLGDEFLAEGEVRLVGATIGASLYCGHAIFHNPGKDALLAAGCEIGFGVFLSNGFTAEGGVRLLGAKIGGNIECHNASFRNPGQKALEADRCEVGGYVILGNNCSVEGAVWLPGITVGGQVICREGRFHNPKGDALVLQGCKVTREVVLDGAFSIEGMVDFAFGHMGGLYVREEAPPQAMTLWCDGLQYGRLFISRERKKSDKAIARAFLPWLDKMPKGYHPQPYEQMAKVLRAQGHPNAAILVQKAKVKRYLKDGSPSVGRRLWLWLLGWTMDYGYRPLKTLRSIIFMVLLGMLVVWAYDHSGAFTRTKPADYEYSCNATVPDATRPLEQRYPTLNPVAYSLEAFTPLLNLHQVEHWGPCEPSRPLFCDWTPPGGFLKWYLWFHTAAGWFLITIFLAGLSGVIKQ